MNKPTNELKFSLKNDYIFKKIFAKEENNSKLKDFLEAILNIEIKKVEVKNPEIPKNMLDEKLAILDIRAEINEDTILDVEMQVANQYNISERSTIYTAKMISSGVKVGEEYKDMKKTISINILNFNYFKTNTYHNIAHMKFEKIKKEEYVDMGYEKEQEMVTEKVEMHFIELPKFVQKDSGTKSKLEQWLWVMVGKGDKMEKAGKENKEVEKTIDELNTMNLSEEERIMYEEREKAIINYNFGMASAERHGREEGLKEGIEKGQRKGKMEGRKEGIEKKKSDMIKNMLLLKIDDDTIKKVAEITDSELESYKKRFNMIEKLDK